MDTSQLLCALNNDPQMDEYEKRVLAKDEFMRARLSKKGVYICNEEPSTKSGSHWMLIVTKPKETYFIDSFGKTPGYYGLLAKLKRLKNKIFSLEYAIQDSLSTLCGEYCLFYAYHICRDFPLDFVNSFFTNDYVRNDQNVKEFIWRKFPGHERISTNIFWFAQNKSL